MLCGGSLGWSQPLLESVQRPSVSLPRAGTVPANEEQGPSGRLGSTKTVARIQTASPFTAGSRGAAWSCPLFSLPQGGLAFLRDPTIPASASHT